MPGLLEPCGAWQEEQSSVHRRVLPEQRPALLGVALVAGLVERGLDELASARRAVRLVAIAAGELALLAPGARRASGTGCARRRGRCSRRRPACASRARHPSPGGCRGTTAQETLFASCGPTCQLRGHRLLVAAEAHAVLHATGVVGSRPKRIIGGRVSPFLTRLAWLPPGPWQASHCSWPLPNGLRASAGWPCAVWNTSLTSGPSWQVRHVSAPFSLYGAPGVGRASAGIRGQREQRTA